jgi:hypothetical protein
MDVMTATDIGTPDGQAAARFWFTRQLWPHVRVWILGLLPCPDLVSRYRMRRSAGKLVTLRTWPGMDATSPQVAQLAMLRLLWLQRQTRRAARGRHREAAIMLARACVETLLLGLYCLREPKAVAQLHAANIKAMGDAFAYFERLDIVPADVIRQCAAKLGKPGPAPKVWRMAETVDNANANAAARDIYHRLYVPLSNFTVHASGGTLLRHVRSDDRLSARPSRSWNRRSPVRVADATAGLLAAALAQEVGTPTEKLLRYAERHFERALMPVAVMGLGGLSGSRKKNLLPRIIRAAKSARDMYDYLWHGRAIADPLSVRIAFIRDRFAAMLDTEGLDVPAGTLDPFIDYVADKLGRIPDMETIRPPSRAGGDG